ncbi:MAG TPA: thioredoxin family protein [Thermodesulfobacteriota bacterium]|nr:thioredoxin family protein [Thermodesulfobacteriota bacterium]
MGNEDITQVKIGSFQVGIIGLKEALSELSASLAMASEDEIGRVLIQRLSKTNYIPEKAKPDYGRALVREFRKHSGQETTPDQENSELVIRVLGQGCANCHALSQRIMEILSELNLAADFEHVTDIKEIARYGVMQSPALLINGRLAAVGRVPNKSQLTEWIKKPEQLNKS